MLKILFNLLLGYIIYMYAIKPFIRGFFNIGNDNIQEQEQKNKQKNKQKEDYTDYEEV